MWVLPSGYCYILQAASVSNDLVSAIYMLASILFILKFGEDGSPKTFFFSALSIALATGTKASNVPLVLPWLIAALIQWKPLLKLRPGVVAGTILASAVVSFLPVAFLNTIFTGDYSGDPHNLSQMKLDNPISGLLGIRSRFSLPISGHQSGQRK